MKNLQALLTNFEGVDLKLTKTGRINQIVRNGMKTELVEAIHADIAEALGTDYSVEITADGVAVAVENETAVIVFTLDPVFKSLEYDINHEADLFAEVLQTRADREAERLAKAEAKAKK